MRIGDKLGRDSDQLFQVLRHLMKCQFMKFWYLSQILKSLSSEPTQLSNRHKRCKFELGFHLCPHFVCTSNEGSDDPARLRRIV